MAEDKFEIKGDLTKRIGIAEGKMILPRDFDEQFDKADEEITSLFSHESSVEFLTDSLTGILKNDYDDKAIRAERIENHENIG